MIINLNHTLCTFNSYPNYVKFTWSIFLYFILSSVDLSMFFFTLPYKCVWISKYLNAVNLSEFASFYGLWSFVILLDKPEIVDLKKSSFTSKNCRGDIISFNCSADANPSMTSYQLFENETAILDTNPSGMWNRKLPTGGVFMYKCVAINYLGSEDSLPVIVEVNGTLNCAVYWICEAYFLCVHLSVYINLLVTLYIRPKSFICILRRHKGSS